MVTNSTTPIDNLEAGKQYFSTSKPGRKLSLEIGQEIANNAYAWYQTHSLSAQAKMFATYLNYEMEKKINE